LPTLGGDNCLNCSLEKCLECKGDLNKEKNCQCPVNSVIDTSSFSHSCKCLIKADASLLTRKYD